MSLDIAAGESASTVWLVFDVEEYLCAGFFCSRTNRVRVAIRDELAHRMGTNEFDIAFTLPTEEFERLREGLRLVFAGFGSLVECAAER